MSVISISTTAYGAITRTTLLENSWHPELSLKTSTSSTIPKTLAHSSWPNGGNATLLTFVLCHVTSAATPCHPKGQFSMTLRTANTTYCDLYRPTSSTHSILPETVLESTICWLVLLFGDNSKGSINQIPPHTAQLPLLCRPTSISCEIKHCKGL